MDFKDYYKTLGLERTATEEEVRKAYRKLARKFHPDVSKEPDAQAKMRELNEANDVLRDKEKRAAYDDLADQVARGHRPGASGPGWEQGFDFRRGAMRALPIAAIMVIKAITAITVIFSRPFLVKATPEAASAVAANDALTERAAKIKQPPSKFPLRTPFVALSGKWCCLRTTTEP